MDIFEFTPDGAQPATIGLGLLLVLAGVFGRLAARRHTARQRLAKRRAAVERRGQGASDVKLTDSERDQMETPLLRAFVLTLAFWVVGLFALQPITYAVSTMARSNPASAAEIAEHMGVSDQAYPIALDGNTALSGAFVLRPVKVFNEGSQRSMRTEEVIPVSFVRDGRTVWFYLPYDPKSQKVKIDQADGVRPSIQLQFSTQQVQHPSLVAATHGPCKWLVLDMFSICRRPVLERTFKDPYDNGQTVQQLVDNNLVLAKLTVTPAIYRELMGAVSGDQMVTPGPTP